MEEKKFTATFKLKSRDRLTKILITKIAGYPLFSKLLRSNEFMLISIFLFLIRRISLSANFFSTKYGIIERKFDQL